MAQNLTTYLMRRLVAVALLSGAAWPALAQVDPYIGEVRCFGFNYAPRGWLPAEGQTLSINQNAALFSLLGTTYGGDGRTTFNLPDLRDRVIVGAGVGPGTEQIYLGQAGGADAATLTPANLPAHAHRFALLASTAAGDTFDPASHIPAAKARSTLYSSGPGPGDAPFAQATTSHAGAGNAMVSNLQPFVTASCAIAVVGIYPSRN